MAEVQQEVFARLARMDVPFEALEHAPAYTMEECAAPARRPGAIDHLALDVDDIESAWEEVRMAGLAPLEDAIQFLPFWENGVRFFNLLGPNGETVEFSQRL